MDVDSHPTEVSLHRPAVLALVLGAFLLPVSPAQALTYTVDTLGDAGDGVCDPALHAARRDHAGQRHRG